MIDPIELARRLIAHDTINPPGNERSCMAEIAAFLATFGWKARLHPFGEGGMNLIVEMVGEDANLSPLVLTGHLDTVPLGAEPWSIDPFAGEIVDGRLYGRGASDMKGGVAAMIVACIRHRSVAMRRGVTLVLTGMEETGCLGASHLIVGGDPAMARASAILVGEPTANRMKTGHKGCLCVRAHYTGITAHSSMPERGVNAIYQAAGAVARVASLDFSRFAEPLLGTPTANVGMMTGGLNLNSVPDHASFTVDVRTNAAGSNAKLRPILETCLDAARVETMIDVAAVSTAPDDPFAGLIRQVLRDRRRETPAEGEAVPFYTDASMLQPHFRAPTIVLGPGEMDQAHQTDEYCRTERIVEATDIYSDIIGAWCEVG